MANDFTNSPETEKNSGRPFQISRHPEDGRITLINDPNELRQIFKARTIAVISEASLPDIFNEIAADKEWAEQVIDAVSDINFDSQYQDTDYIGQLSKGDKRLHQALTAVSDRVSYLSTLFIGLASHEPQFITLHEKEGRYGRVAARDFHVDHAPIHLVSSVFGPGTEWVGGQFTTEQLKRLNFYGTPPEGRNRHLIPEGNILVFKGYRDDNIGLKKSLIHNSPKTKGQPRLAFSFY